MRTRKNSTPRDERLESIGHKAGYYAFIVTFPLTVLTFLVVIFDFKNGTEYSSIAMLATFWIGGGTYVVYLWKHKHGPSTRELLWRDPKKMKTGLKHLLWAVPFALAVSAASDYVMEVWFHDRPWVLMDRLWPIIRLVLVIAASMYLTVFRKPNQS